MKVLIVDDHALLRSGLRRILSDELEGIEVGEASTADEMMAQVRVSRWDLVLLDISMPGRSGLDALRDVRALRPRLPVLILSMHSEEQFAIRALKAGAAGYITKERAPEELIGAVKKVLPGGRYVSASLAEKLAEELSAGLSEEMPHERLSARELEVLLGIASGKVVSEIAASLCLSVKTVSTYRARILEKMRMRTNADLMNYAIRRGLIQ